MKETQEKYGAQAIAIQTAVDSLTTFLPKLLKGQENRIAELIGMATGFHRRLPKLASKEPLRMR
ncbi:MAG: hypothetical protein ACLSVD_05575 [Eggerthellaceae bacterium]